MRFLFFFLLLYEHGFTSTNDCPHGQHRVKAYFRDAYFRANGTYVKATSVDSYCRQDRESDKHWQDKLKSGRPDDWPYDVEKSGAWSLQETERVLEALCELPKEIWENSTYKIYRMNKSKDGQNPATSAESIIVLYDSAFKQKNNLSRVLAHEFAHEKYRTLKESEAINYRISTNWFILKTKGKSVQVSRKDGFVADDGRVSPEEDFANNVEFYLFEPNKLESTTPHGFAWIKKHFSDKFKTRSCN